MAAAVPPNLPNPHEQGDRGGAQGKTAKAAGDAYVRRLLQACKVDKDERATLTAQINTTTRAMFGGQEVAWVYTGSYLNGTVVPQDDVFATVFAPSSPLRALDPAVLSEHGLWAVQPQDGAPHGRRLPDDALQVQLMDRDGPRG